MNASLIQGQGRGTYPLGEAARLAHLPVRTVRRWSAGYAYRRHGEARRAARIEPLRPVGDYSSYQVLDFEQLLTLMLVRAFRHRGLGLAKIRQAALRAREMYGLANPFVSRQFKTDGNRVFIELAPHASEAERELIDVLSDQRQFCDIVQPSLFDDVVFAGDMAGQWWPMGPARGVVLSPSRQFGAPHLAGTGVRTDVVALLVNAEGGGPDAIGTAAGWYGLTRDQVTDAVEFETEWLIRPLP